MSTLSAKFDDYMRCVYRGAETPDQRQHLRQAFFAGAMEHTLAFARATEQPDGEPAEAALARLKAVDDEVIAEIAAHRDALRAAEKVPATNPHTLPKN